MDRSLLRDERGWVFTHIAALVIAPILLVVMATAAITVLRTGAGITNAMDRALLAQTLLEDFERSVASSSSSTWANDEVVTVIDPATIPATAAPHDGLAVCTTVTWTIHPGQLDTLTRTVQRHQTASCGSPVAATVETSLTGLVNAKFTMANPFGRQLTEVPGHSFGYWNAADQPVPAGVAQGHWSDTRVATVRFDARMQEVIGSHTVHATARTPVLPR